MTRYDELVAKAKSGDWTPSECEELEILVLKWQREQEKNVIRVNAEDLKKNPVVKLKDGREVVIEITGGI